MDSNENDCEAVSQKAYVPIRDRPAEERPRERLLTLGPEKMSNGELLAILINKGTRGRSALQVAEELLASWPDGVRELAKKSATEVGRTKGMGKAATARLLAAMELGRRAREATADERPQLNTSAEVARLFRRIYGAGAPEKFVAFYVNRQRVLLGQLEVSRGGSNSVVVDPRRIFKEALLLDAKGVVLAHNHPDGTLVPSQQDLELTKQVFAAGQVCRIPVVTHLIVTGEYAASIQL